MDSTLITIIRVRLKKAISNSETAQAEALMHGWEDTASLESAYRDGLVTALGIIEDELSKEA